ncbi:MAG TPA: hypothetical protein VMW66_03115 [Elusimicrobiales bacterium]|nr:hypothetical protein [Elusimicrobiales bacterium]
MEECDALAANGGKEVPSSAFLFGITMKNGTATLLAILSCFVLKSLYVSIVNGGRCQD